MTVNWFSVSCGEPVGCEPVARHQPKVSITSAMSSTNTRTFGLVLIGRQLASQQQVLAVRGGEGVLEGGDLGPVPIDQLLGPGRRARTAAEVESTAPASASGLGSATRTVLLRMLVILDRNAGCR